VVRTPSVFSCLLIVSCGGSSPPASTPTAQSAAAGDAPPATSDSAASTDPPPPAGLPTACADKSASVCTPGGVFVDRLCGKPHQDIALALFAKSTPFTRLYLKGKMDELVFGEEVLALRFHGQPKGGMQVGSGNGSYDVLRWDGSCSMAVDAEMLGNASPGKPKAARVLWHRLSDAAQSALIAGSDAVKKAHAKRGHECQGAMSGDVSAGCQKADSALVDAIVDYVRGGGTLPSPDAP
jgi:hypothetical protein